MRLRDPEFHVLLIGGSSNSGKSTLGQALAEKLGWKCVSTDHLARHPGRPWKTERGPVPEHVAEHYLSLPVEELLADVLRHYRGMWPGLEDMIESHASDPSEEALVLEGSALWPESVAGLSCENVRAIWLAGDEALFQSRIHELSGFEAASEREREMIQKFLDRTCLYNERMLEAVKRLGLQSLDVRTSPSVERLCAAALGSSSGD